MSGLQDAAAGGGAFGLFAVLFGLGLADGVGAAAALLGVVGGVEDDGLGLDGEVLRCADLRAFGGQGGAGGLEPRA